MEIRNQHGSKKEGAYQVFARVEDQVGNAAFFGGNTIVIDKTTPRITVEGVTDQSANNGSLKLRILCEDNYYWKGSLEATLIGDRNGEKKLKYERKKTDKGEQLILNHYRRRGSGMTIMYFICQREIRREI